MTGSKQSFDPHSWEWRWKSYNQRSFDG